MTVQDPCGRVIERLESELASAQKREENLREWFHSAQAVIDAAQGLVATVDSPDSMHMVIDREQELYALGLVRAALAAHLERYPREN